MKGRFIQEVACLVFFAAGCTDELVEVQGIATLDSPTSDELATSVAVSLANFEGDIVDETVTNDKGLYRLSAPSGEGVHLFVRGLDGGSSSFYGVAGMPATP